MHIFFRNSSSTDRPAKMSGAANWNEGTASSGLAGFLPQKSRNRDGVFPKSRKISRKIHGQNKKHKGPSAVQVRGVMTLKLV